MPNVSNSLNPTLVYRKALPYLRQFSRSIFAASMKSDSVSPSAA